jgi:hypothetical protein
MSLFDTNCKYLKDYLIAMPNDSKLLIRMFSDFMDFQGWYPNDIIEMLNYSKGISTEIDYIIDEFIKNELRSNK